MADQGIAVIPIKEPVEYYVLNTTYQEGLGGEAEEFLDQTCTLE
jgi:hypothetical protein